VIRSRHLLLPLLVAASGCVGLRLTAIKATQKRPSNVAVYFKVQTGSGDPGEGLTAESFRIYEDGQRVSQFESKQTILNPEVAAVHYTMLLVDMSGSVSESGNGEVIPQAVSAFTLRVERQQKVAIYAFDGSPDLYPIAAFTDQAVTARAGVQQLAIFKPRDPSTNLNGAIVRALDELEAALGRARQAMRFGTLVVFTDGTDRASRVSTGEMRQRIRETPFDVFAIGLGAEIKASELREIGKSGTAMAEDKNAIVKAFDDVGSKVEARTRSFYLLSYCSPSRAGQHDVRIEAVLKGDPSKGEQTGSLRSDFDATGFGPGCDPNAPPSFDVTRGDALAPPQDEPRREEKKGDHETRRAKPPRPASQSPPRPAPPPRPPPAQTPAAEPSSQPSDKPQDFNP
jgi:von Willebrand factor type A domain